MLHRTEIVERAPDESEEIEDNMSPLKATVQKALFMSGYYDLVNAIRRVPEDRLLIIMYHDIAEDSLVKPGPGGWDGRLTRKHFAAQVEAFCRWYRVLTVQQALDEMNGSDKPKTRTVAITFDDGYQSVYTEAFPILKKHGVPATVFPLTDWIDGKMTLWWEATYHLIVGARLTPDLVARMESIVGESFIDPAEGNLNQISVRKAINRKVEGILRQASDDCRNSQISQLQALLSPHSNKTVPDHAPVTWDQIREMAAAGFEIGCHTRTHLNLGTASLEVAEGELRTSKSLLEDWCGKAVQGLAFPYGSHDGGYHHLEPMLRKLGFTYACTTFPGVNDSHTGPFGLRRSTLPSTSSLPIIGRTLAVEFLESSGN